MGDRAGYRFVSKKEVSPIYRVQWMKSINGVVQNTWDTLCDGKPIDDGSCALRTDLGIGRAFAACIYSNYTPPFESIENITDCDISDEGLFEIDISNYKKWVVYHYDVSFEDGKLSNKKEIGFIDGKINTVKFNLDGE